MEVTPYGCFCFSTLYHWKKDKWREVAFGWVNIVKYKETKKFLMKKGGWNTW